MIARLWRGRVPPARAAEYTAYQHEVGPPGYRAIDGNVGILMLGRDTGTEYEIAMLTLWESWAAIRAFAGDPPDRARYYDRDADFLIDLPERVEHFRVEAVERLRQPARIVRLWTGTVDASRAAEALRLEAEIGIPAYRAVDGNRGVLLLQGDGEARNTIAMVTLWSSLDGMRAFAGDPPDRADYTEYDRRSLDYLTHRPQRAEIFDALDVSNVAQHTVGRP